MARIDWRDWIVVDYRDRILVDPDNPIVALRAHRDRYSDQSIKRHPEYAEASHLGSSESNDAIIWNVFRSLQKAARLAIITDELEIGEPRGLVLWGLAPEANGESAELQYIVNDSRRKLEACFAEELAEPEVTLLGTTGIAVGIGSDAPHLAAGRIESWEGNLEQVAHLRAHLENYPGFLKPEVADSELTPVYRLVKMALFAKELSTRLGVAPVVGTLASTRRFYAREVESGRCTADVWGTFEGLLGENSVVCRHIFWQNVTGLKTDPSILTLSLYLLTHPYLYDVGYRFYNWDGYEWDTGPAEGNTL